MPSVEGKPENPSHGAPEDSEVAPNTVRALSPAQERKLLDHLEERFLEVTRNYKKRRRPHLHSGDPSSTLPTLFEYLETTHHMLSLILQIPPVDPSAPLRTSILLRLTGEVLQAIPGYTPDTETLPLLLAWLNDLDKAWLAVLRVQGWDPEECRGIDVERPPESRSTPVSQTERTRLRSLLIAGSDGLEEWLLGLDTAGEGSFEVTLQRLGLEQSFNELFAETLAEMGSLGSVQMNDPRGMVGTC